jgi:hypothetical protein
VFHSGEVKSKGQGVRQGVTRVTSTHDDIGARVPADMTLEVTRVILMRQQSARPRAIGKSR